MKPQTLNTQNYPLKTRDAELQAETVGPEIASIQRRMPTILPSVVKERGVQGSTATPQKGTGSQPWDSVSDLSETNVRMQFVNLTAEPIND